MLLKDYVVLVKRKKIVTACVRSLGNKKRYGNMHFKRTSLQNNYPLATENYHGNLVSKRTLQLGQNQNRTLLFLALESSYYRAKFVNKLGI